MNRRFFLYTGAAALGGVAALRLPQTLMAAPTNAAVPANLGVQMYTIRDVFPNDFVGVLEAIKGMGYQYAEFAGYHNRPPRVVRAVLDSVGLTSPSAHIPLEAFQNNLDATLEDARTVGHEYLIIPWLDQAQRQKMDDYRRFADLLNTLGEKVKAAGMKLAYHNHDFEYETFGGDTPAYDVLLAETDPALVAMQMDLFWTVNAGYDPVAYFGRYPGRFALFHVKDRTADGKMVDVGAGAIDFARIFDHADQAGLRYAIVEHDEPGDALQSLQHSYSYLKGLRGA